MYHYTQRWRIEMKPNRKCMKCMLHDEYVLMGIEVESKCYPLLGFSLICQDLCDKPYLVVTM